MDTVCKYGDAVKQSPVDFAQYVLDECKLSSQPAINVIAQFVSLRDTAILCEAAGWISVEERLPECIGHVLVYFCEDWNYDKLWKIGWAFYNSDKKFCYETGVHSTVTHWMPLPPPPAGKKEV